MVVGERGIENAIALVGEVRPRYESNQGFRISGKEIERTLDVGARVKKGQVIARLDASNTNLSAAAARAGVRAAEASYALVEAEVEHQRQLFLKIYFCLSARYS